MRCDEITRSNETTSSSPFFPLVEIMKNEGIYLDEETFKVKSSHPLAEKPIRPIDEGRTGRAVNEEKAVLAVNEAIRQATLLPQDPHDLSQAARIVEKIQMDAVEAERAAFITKSDCTKKCFQIVHRISILSRQIFHELKIDLKKQPHAA